MYNEENTPNIDIPALKPPVTAISHGATNGIGYEIIIKALADPRIFDFITPVVYGNSKLASYHRKTDRKSVV